MKEVMFQLYYENKFFFKKILYKFLNCSLRLYNKHEPFIIKKKFKYSIDLTENNKRTAYYSKGLLLETFIRIIKKSRGKVVITKTM
jgi:hypothetical protein